MKDRPKRRPPRGASFGGFTLLEVLLAMAIIAIAVSAVLRSQSQGLSLAREAGFLSTAALLAQAKMAEVDAAAAGALIAGTGEFGDAFPGYAWELNLGGRTPGLDPEVNDRLQPVDLTVLRREDPGFRYRLRLYRLLNP